MFRQVARTHVARLERRTIASYTEQYRRSLDTPEAFWAEAAQELTWFKPWTQVLESYVARVRLDISYDIVYEQDALHDN